MYTNTLFLYFSDFSIFFYMKNKINKTENKQKKKKNMLSKAKHKTKLTQNKSKTHKLCKKKTQRERRK